MKRNSLIIFYLAVIMGSLTACSFTPEYTPPDVAMPANFKEISKDWEPAKPADQLSRGEWWKVFNDPTLNDLVEKAITNNFQIQAAVARYDISRAFVAANNAGLYPQVGAIAGSSENRQSVGRPLRGSNQPNIYDNNQFGGAATYELDLWGRVRSSINSASALSQASEAELESIRLVVTADLVSSYIAMRGVESQIEILDSDLDLYQKQASLMQMRFEQGINSGADFYRVQSLVDTGKARKAELKTRRAQLEHVLALLTGVAASNFSLASEGLTKLSMPPMALQIPSTLLERRPDIAAAERRVAATNEDIGVAKSAFFPVISLAALGGYQTANQANILTAPNAFWTIGPIAFLTIFDGGRRAALVDQAVAKNAENTAIYKNTVLAAIKEVEDILVDIKDRQATYENVEDNAKLATKTYLISTFRYEQGIASYLEIVDAAIDQSRAKTAQIDYQTQLLIDRVLLIKALGGYW